MISVTSKVASDSGVSPLQEVNFTGVSPAEWGKTLLEKAGLITLESRKNAFLSDPGSTVMVERTGANSGSLVTNASKGWLVVDSCDGNHRGTLFTTMAGAVAQVWSILSMQQSISAHDIGTMSSVNPMSRTASTLAFQVTGPNGVKSVVLADLQGV